MGYFNAKVGYNNTGYEQTMGRHGIGQMNENGERFAELCANNKCVIGGSMFAHKRIHKATWVSPVMLNWSFVALSFRKLTLYLTLGFFMVNTFLNFIRILPTSK
jgi:hypothetical protein